MRIIRYEENDAKEIVSLFYDTIHSVSLKDYTQKAVDAWAPIDEKESKVKTWKESLNQNITYVAKIDDGIVGFGDLTYSGYLDRLFVHKEHQRQGIATAIVELLETEAMQLNLIEIQTEASITAKPFFEQRGYNVICKQTVERKGVNLVNYKMVKRVK
ncbi:GNAT family N-acetyltransferase [Geomicrobium sediminis]|uniref:Acetyltransferase n=1 Tax=Geomicrobium sediminis TaxID=1347788 RepID=A0ABS2P6C5_9BACL|nr:GNAT family N-acetyltransferase [Geomicrobium sediminis]MBM7630964.1 putative acetyltransferase [Geomicrobium sediminis]